MANRAACCFSLGVGDLPILPSREARVPKTIRPKTLAAAAVPAMMISDQTVGPRFAARLLRRCKVASVEHLQKSKKKKKDFTFTRESMWQRLCHQLVNVLTANTH